ncbi:MAG TPA: hypothetical protein VFG63_05175 [Nocardioidaceae bacterium]|nr:hypothetical protein [Nocardioidaceae bacterium]
MRIVQGLAAGLAAGAAGTTALNAATYLDMVVRGRAASSTPEKTVKKLAAHAHLTIPGDQESRGNRVSGLGPLTGIATGAGVGGLLGITRAVGFTPSVPVAGLLVAGTAMGATDTSMATLGITDPKTWSATDWLSDVIPHLAYGLVTAWVLAGLDRRSRPAL